MITEINTLETTTVTISKNALKCSTGDWIIYNRNWLLDNLETEMSVLRSTKETKDKIEKKLRGEYE